MTNSTSFDDLPPLPAYTLSPRPSTIPGISDTLFQLLLPIIAYWVVSLFFHALDTYDIFPQYRLHTPAELLKRNHVTRYEVVRDVLMEQFIQTMFGLAIAAFDPIEMTGREEYDIASWARRLRLAQRSLPQILSWIGLDSIKLGAQMQPHSPGFASVLAGGRYSTPGFAPWEIIAAKAIYWVGIPVIQFAFAIFFVDTWQYFLHRAMHMNKFLYTTLHSRHHRLYVPYAFGALYNHPMEGFLLDTLGAGVAYLVTGMSVRQGTWFFTCSTIKTVDDHCGYAFPWDPLQHITSNNAAYHDVHHQSWGIKTNFSQPFFIFWDRILGTVWTGGDVSMRYERDRVLAQKKAEAGKKDAVDTAKAAKRTVASQQQSLNDKKDGGERILRDEKREEQETRQTAARSTRRKTSGFDAKSLTDRVAESLHGRSTAILHADGGH